MGNQAIRQQSRRNHLQSVSANVDAVHRGRQMSNPVSINGELAHKRIPCLYCKAEIDQLKQSLAGREKAYGLLNKGFESACELQSELKQRVRELEAKVTYYEKQVSDGCPICNAIANDAD